MNPRILECVPNISEGRNLEKIQEIASVVKKIPGVYLLDIDPGAATNRTVITFAGEPEAVIEAAFLLIQKAAQLIDMRLHKGEHPRFGATDVCPLIPITGITMDETITYAEKLAARVGNELKIPVYQYEYSAKEEKRKNLANCREGEYEGLAKKLKDPTWKPDYGTTDFSLIEKTGAIAIGARKILVAYNINLNTTSTRRANAIAFDVREAGRVQRKGDPLTGEIMLDEQGEPLKIPGTLKHVKAIGWYIEEYGIAQISINLTNIEVTPVHTAFDECCQKAQERGLRVTGSELVGLIPLSCLLDAADHFLKKQGRSIGISEKEKIKIAVKSLGLDDLKPFIAEEKIIEYKLASMHKEKSLIPMSLQEFVNEAASESPAPGGGSVSAYVGALGVALGTMVANLSAHKRGWDHRVDFFSEFAQKGQEIQKRLLFLVDEDTKAFNKILEGFAMPKNTEEEKVARKQYIQSATQYAVEIPLQVMQTCFESFSLMENMLEEGITASISDVGVGVMCCRTAIYGAYFNVLTNLNSIENKEFLNEKRNQADHILNTTLAFEKAMLSNLMQKISK